MGKLEALAWLGLCSCLGTGCATSAIDAAPARPDRPWTPAVAQDGELQPGKAEPNARPEGTRAGYVLPANPALAALPQPPAGLDAKRAYTLPELIDLAESNNPSTRVAWLNAREAALAAGIVESTYLPEVSASVVGAYQYGHGENSAFGFSADDHVSVAGALAALSLRWLLFDFGGRSALVDAAKQGSLLSNIAFTAAHQRIIYEVTLAFYANAAAVAHLQSAETGLQNAHDVEVAGQARFAQGIGTVIEVAQAHQATAQAELIRVQADGSARDTYLRLIAAMGVSPLTKLQVADVSDRRLSVEMIPPIERIVTRALEARPDMLSAHAAQKVSLANLRAAQAAFLPKLFLSATGSYRTSDIDVVALPGLGSDAPTLNLSGHAVGFTVLLGATVPVFDGGRRSATVAQARARVDKADATLSGVRNEAVRQVVSAQTSLKSSLAARDASLALVSAADTTYSAALDAYRNGLGSVTETLIAETQLLAARNAAVDAYSTALSAAASLALAAGTLGGAPAP
ncbi:MAG: TolC family protein [Pseudomonadota bacterium]